MTLAMTWFRLYSEFATDPVVQSLAFDDQRHFVVVLCLKCSGVLDREFPDPAARTTMLRRALSLDGVGFDEANKRLQSANLVDLNWQPKNWSKRQFISDQDPTAAERKRRQREKEVTDASRVTDRDSHGDVTDASHRSDSESESELKIGQRPSAFDLFWSVYPKKVKRKTTAEIWNRKRLDSKSDELIADVQRRLQSDKRWRDGFIPDPTTYLNQERWGDEMTVVKRPRVEGL